MNNEMSDLRAETLTAHGRAARPRVHGNGFIQLDLTPARRLHIWGDPRIPRQKVPSTIHDHTFTFSSRIYRGQMVHREIDLRPHPDGAYRLYQAVTRRGEDTRLVGGDERYDARITRERLLRVGATYSFEAGQFHETVAPWLCVSVIDKDGPTLAQGGKSPNILVPYDLAPDNTFDRYQTKPDFLWAIIFDALVDHA